MRRLGSLLAVLLLCAAAPQTAGAACKLAKLAALDIVIDGNSILVPGVINGHDVYFLLDTGAGAGTMLFPAPAAAIGVTSGGSAGYVYGATGSDAAVKVATVETLKLGLWEGHNITLPAVGAEAADSKVIGLLGEDILRHFDIEIDVKNHLLALYKPEGCDDVNLAFWSDSYNSVDFAHFDERHPAILFDGKIGDTTLRMQLDTGAPHSLMAFDVARSLGVGPDSPGAQSLGPVHGINGSPEEAWAANFPSFTLDAEVIKPARLGFFRFARAQAEIGTLLGHRAFETDMLIGMDFIKAHHLLISHSQKKVYFTYAGGKPFF